MDPTDSSEYRSAQNWNDNVVNVCQDSTYRFLEVVIDEIIGIYAEAEAPLNTIHVGGDEVPGGVWQQSPVCQEFLAGRGEMAGGRASLPSYFLSRLQQIFAERNLQTSGWEEIGLAVAGEESRSKEPNLAFVDSHFRVYTWNSIPGWGGEENAYKLANAGYQVVLCNASNLYFDLAYRKDPDEIGLYWAGFVDTRKPFEFAPFDLYRSVTVDLMGNAIDVNTVSEGKARLTPQGRKNILGIQGQLWGENSKGAEALEYSVAPELLLSLSGRGPRSQRGRKLKNRTADYFWTRIGTRSPTHLGRGELPRLDYLWGGFRYRLPLPGALIEDGILKANVAFPGLDIRYTVDGTVPSPGSRLYTEPVKVDNAHLRTFDQKGQGSRINEVI